MRVSYEDCMGGFAGVFIITITAAIVCAILITVNPGSTLEYRDPRVVFAALDAAVAFIAVLIMVGDILSKRKLEITGMRPACRNCGTAMENSESEFCSKCGAGVTAIAAPPLTETQRFDVPPAERVGVCMVCNLDLTTSDLAAWCPHCGNPAHRSHLLEWVHVKNRCPKCGEHLAEREVTTKPLKTREGRKIKKKTWRTI
jgi:Zn finger protein HypA/HybF involved in hydrogenase expression